MPLAAVPPASPGPEPKIGPAVAAALKQAGIDLIAALPDAWLSDVIEVLDQDPDVTLVRVAREDEGVGVCAGAFLGGRKAALLGQNAGFLLSVNALAGLALHHHIPILMLLAHRGGIEDNQYFQVYKGRVTEPVLDALHIPHHRLAQRSDLVRIGQGARQAWLSRGPVALLLTGEFLGQGGRQ
jgi:sulfopyruvate decarboxylase subunit alpha